MRGSLGSDGTQGSELKLITAHIVSRDGACLDACAGSVVALEPSLLLCNGNTTGCSLSPKAPSQHPPTTRGAHGAGGCEPCPAPLPAALPSAVQTPEPWVCHRKSPPRRSHSRGIPRPRGEHRQPFPWTSPDLSVRAAHTREQTAKRVGARQGSAARGQDEEHSRDIHQHRYRGHSSPVPFPR